MLRLSWILLFLVGVPSAGAKGQKSHEHEVERAGVKLTLFEKWTPGDESKWRQNGKVVLLVHGATWSSRCTFDTADDYSLMDDLAAAGYDVFAIDLHGYGKSGKTERDWTEAETAAEDLDAAADYIRAFRWIEKIHLLGYQWGAQAVGLFANKHPKKVAKLALFGMRYRQAERKAEPAEQYRRNTPETAMLRPEDGDLDPAFVRRRAQICAAADPQSPNGALRDLTQRSAVRPEAIKQPTLLIMGDREGDTVPDRVQFFQELASAHKWFVVLPGLGKLAPIERGRAKFTSALIAFFEQP